MQPKQPLLMLLLAFSSCSCGSEKVAAFPVTETLLTDDVWLGQTFALTAFDGGNGFVAAWPVRSDAGVDLVAALSPSKFMKRGSHAFRVAEWPPASTSTWFVENSSEGFATIYVTRGGQFRYQRGALDIPIVDCPVRSPTETVAALRSEAAFVYVDGCQLRCQDRAQWFRLVDGGFIGSPCSGYSGLIVPLSQDRPEFAVLSRSGEITSLRLDGIDETVTSRTLLPPDAGVYATNVLEGGRAVIRDGGSSSLWFSLQDGLESARPLPGVGPRDVIEGFAAASGAPLHTFALVVKNQLDGHLKIVALNGDRFSQTPIENFAIRHQLIAVESRYHWVGIRPLADGGGEAWGMTVESP